MAITGAQILIEELVNHGVDTVFGYPGGAVLNIYDELYKNSDRIKHIISAHEQGAAHAADGYARASGKVGVVIATSGPGATNLVTGIANAYLDSIPMIAITGNVAVNLIGKDSFQEVDTIGITQPIVKHNYVVRDVKMLEQTIKEAFHIATTGRKGPVLIDIPKSVQLEHFEYINESINVEYYHDKPHNNYKSALEKIKQSKRPYIYCGGGVLSSNAEDEVLELSKRISAPVGLSMMGLSAIPSSYNLNLGMSGMHGKYVSSKAQSECDLMIAVGVRFSDRATGNINEFTKKCTVIHIDIDDAELDKNVKSQIGLCGDVKQILQTLLESIEPSKNEEWLKEIENYKQHEYLPTDNEFSPHMIINTVNNWADDKTVVATDVGQHQMWTMQYYKFEKPRTLLTSGGLGTMGFGLGAAIGGCVATGGNKTILFTSDGSFGMNLTELATAVSQNLPVVIVILNNGVLGMVRQWQTMFFDKRYSQTTLNRKTNFSAVAKAFGADGYCVENIDELKNALFNVKNNTPCVIDCLIDMDENVFPMIPPGGSINNIVLKG